MHDKLIRGGTVVDGSGRQAFSADVAIDNGFVFGDSVYEVVRTYGGRPFESGRHFASYLC